MRCRIAVKREKDSKVRNLPDCRRFHSSYLVGSVAASDRKLQDGSAGVRSNRRVGPVGVKDIELLETLLDIVLSEWYDHQDYGSGTDFFGEFAAPKLYERGVRIDQICECTPREGE